MKVAAAADSKAFLFFAIIPATNPDKTSPVPPTVIAGIFFGFKYVVLPSDTTSVALLANKNVVVTPHAGEFKRLFGQIPAENTKQRISAVEKFASQNSITILLKGATDVVSDGKTTYLNPKKIPAMTVGGTGDVLSGLVAGIMAKNRNALEAAAAATFINGLAGKLVQRKLGLHMTSMDLLDVIPQVMKQFDKIN